MGEAKYLSKSWEIAQIDTRRLYQDDNLVEAVAVIGIGSRAHRLTFSGTTTEEDFLAIVRLVAAAPELLEALQCLLSVSKSFHRPTDDLGWNQVLKAEASIAKATLR